MRAGNALLHIISRAAMLVLFMVLLNKELLLLLLLYEMYIGSSLSMRHTHTMRK
jgi:hypothetical protein